jgi:hypothetical protein
MLKSLLLGLGPGIVKTKCIALHLSTVMPYMGQTLKNSHFRLVLTALKPESEPKVSSAFLFEE